MISYLVFLMTTCVVSFHAAAVDSTLVAQLMDAMEKLRENSAKTSGSATYKEWKILPSAQSRISRDSEELTPVLRELSVRGDHCVKSIEVKDGIERVQVANSEYAFFLTRPKGGSYSIAGLKRRGQSITDDIYIEQRIAEVRLCFFAAYDFYGRTVWGLVRDPGFKLTKIEMQKDISGEDRLRVDFDYSPSHRVEKVTGIKDWHIKDGYLIFAPQDGWKLTEYCRGFFPGTIQGFPKTVQSIDDYPSDQLAFTQQYVAKLYAADGKNVDLELHVLRMKSNSEAIPKEHFYLSHYGFPEPNFDSTARWPWVVGGLMLGAICIVASRRLMHR